MKSYRALCDAGLAVRRKSPPAAVIASAIGWHANRSSPRKIGRRSTKRWAWAASQRWAAWRSQSCFAAPSWGAMNSGIMGKAMAWPGATTVPASMAWSFSVLPLPRRRVRHCGQPSFCEQKYSVPSSAISTRPPSRWKPRSPPCRRSISRVWSKAGCRCEGCTGSSMARIWLSVGTAVMPNRLWQFDPTSTPRFCKWLTWLAKTGKLGARGTTPGSTPALRCRGWAGRGWRWRRDALDPRWDGDTAGPQQGRGGRLDVGADLPGLAALDHLRLLQPVEVAQHVVPFRHEACGPAALEQLLLQHQGEEGAEDVATDGGVGGVVDWARA